MLSRLRRAAAGFAEDRAADMGAALAYYTLFSLAPLLGLCLVVLGGVFGEDDSRARLVGSVADVFDADTARAVRLLLENAKATKDVVAGRSLVGVVLLFVGAAGMFGCLRGSLHKIWRLAPKASTFFVVDFFRGQLLTVAMALITCELVLVVAFSGFVVAEVHDLAVRSFAADGAAVSVFLSPPAIDVYVTACLLAVLFLFTYRLLSDGRLSYAQVLPGAVTTGLLFAVGKVGIAAYLAYADLGSTFGAAGSVVVLLAWVYYSAQIVFFGAEVIRAGLPGPAKSDAGLAPGPAVSP